MQDREILDLYFARNEAAITETEAKYGRYCFAIAIRILADEDDASEVLNDTWWKTWNTVPPSRPDPLKPYVGMICRQLSLNRYEAKTAQKRGGGAMPAVLDELAECIANGDGDVCDGIALREAMNRFLAGLSKKTRVMFVRRYYYACTVAEIAALCGMRENAVAAALMRTRRKLKAYLEKGGFSV